MMAYDRKTVFNLTFIIAHFTIIISAMCSLLKDINSGCWFHKLSVIEKAPVEKVLASPLTCTRSPWSSHQSSPPRAEHWRACRVDLLSRLAQYGMRVQCADPVTGSSNIVAWGVKKRETKSCLFPGAVTITPPDPRLI